MNFICFDTEDDSAELMEAGKSGFDKRVTQIAAICGNGDEYYSKGNVREFLRWLEKRKETRIYALNIGYDLGNLFRDKIDVLDATLIGGRIIKAVWRKKVFVDVYNLCQMSVKTLGEKLGLEKLDFAPDSREYVFRDVEIIHKFVSHVWEFCERTGIGNCPTTSAGCAMKLWKSWGGRNTHDSSQSSRDAYYGGRVELFKPRNIAQDVCYTDINSLYPSVMRNNFPAVMEVCRSMPEYGIASCDVEQPETDLTVLPWRNQDDEILYPSGQFTGTWTVHELREAERRGLKILKVHSFLGSNDFSAPYREFMERVYKLRQTASDKAEALFYKLCMNSFYGRFGLSGMVSRTVWRDPDTERAGVPFGEKVLVDYQMPLPKETNWSHAAYITSYGRLRLLEYLSMIGADRMIYCDTDSCIFDAPGRRIPFKPSGELGEMKLEGWERFCECYAPKTYRFGNDHKAKGVPRRLAKQFIEERKVSFALPFKLRESIRFFDDGNKKTLSVWRKVVKSWETDYTKKELKKGRFYPCKVSELS
jgi:hypothetical protein